MKILKKLDLKKLKISFNDIFFISLVILIIFFVFVLVYLLSEKRHTSSEEKVNISTEYVEFFDNTQIIHIKVSDRFEPDTVFAKSGFETTLKFKTEKVVGCLSMINIPSLKIYERLPISGEKDIKLNPQTSGTVLIVTCSSGQNILKIKFI